MQFQWVTQIEGMVAINHDAKDSMALLCGIFTKRQTGQKIAQRSAQGYERRRDVIGSFSESAYLAP